MIGTSIGPYRVTDKLGEGGMGAVYRARDTRLDREVAVKTLLEAFAGDPDRLARFEREARLLASLNHPHIAQVYGLEVSGETRALVMELVDGPTLAERLAHGALPADEAVPIARQIAGALEAAHEHGIIHRDLKPANIKLRADGTVKVLDFGLAKLSDSGTSIGAGDASALTSPAMTRAGLILGTPAYMSPEQARGKAVDARADLWAFGCVLYEMLAGRRAFDGETTSDAISSVLAREPDWDALPASTPAAVRRLLRRCLAKDVTKRIRHAGDARLDLEDIASAPAIGEPPPSQEPTITRSYLPWTIAAIATLLALGLGWRAMGSGPGGATGTAMAPSSRLELTLPAGLEIAPNTGSVAASRDGRSVAFVGTAGGVRQLYVRRLDAFEATPIRGSTGALSTVFSFDGRAIAVVTSAGELRTISLADGLQSAVVRNVSTLYGLTWTAGDEVIFVRNAELWTTSRPGGEPRQLTTLAADEQFHGWPSMTPDGKSVVFSVGTATGRRVDAVTLPNGPRRIVLDQATFAKVGPQGRLFFYRDGVMLSASFDAAALATTGPPIPVADMPDTGGAIPTADVSPGGIIVFSADSPMRRLVWVSRDGTDEPANETPRGYLNPRLSPDGSRIAVQAGGIWVHELRRRTAERLPMVHHGLANAFPVWLPDNETVMHRTGAGLRLQSIAGSQARTLPGTTEFDYPGGATPDGKTLIIQRSTGTTSFDILTAPLADPSRTSPLVQTPAYEAGARLSPDGKWLVYVSNQSGAYEVYVRAFQGDERRRQVSSGGGLQPAWNPNGQEIFYRNGDRMFAVSVTPAGKDLVLSSPRQLFARAFSYGGGITIANYDVAPDGQRFIMVKDETPLGRLRVILDWRVDSVATATPPR